MLAHHITKTIARVIFQTNTEGPLDPRAPPALAGRILLGPECPERGGHLRLHTYWQRNDLGSLCCCLPDKAAGSSDII